MEKQNIELLRYLPKPKFCKLHTDEELLRCFNETTSTLDVFNIFNPSFYCDKDVMIFTFRAFQKGENESSSFISVISKQGQTIRNISKDFSEKLGVSKLIDPKVTRIEDEYYVTSNTGWDSEGNDIFIMKVYPNMDIPKRVLYPNRQEQERNWAFFSENGEIYVLYWINPLKILRLKNRGQETWDFEDYYCGDERRGLSNDLTIGTQLSTRNDDYYFIAHKKHHIQGKKIYTGRLCTFNFKNKEMKIGDDWLAHSLASMFGSRIRHNTNLFSCTYFSGMQVTNDIVKLGYGVNDVEYGFSKHKLRELIGS